jgi:hypothetical protein
MEDLPTDFRVQKEKVEESLLTSSLELMETAAAKKLISLSTQQKEDAALSRRENLWFRKIQTVSLKARLLSNKQRPLHQRLTRKQRRSNPKRQKRCQKKRPRPYKN